jgi:hypothetical protein
MYIRRECTYKEQKMAARIRNAGMRAKRGPARKVARTFRLTPGKVEAAQRILGARTATDAVETALDMVVFRRELVEGVRSAFGIDIRSADRPTR